MFLSLVSAALLSVATLHPDCVFSTLSTPKIGSPECGAMDLDCWKREAEKVGDLKAESDQEHLDGTKGENQAERPPRAKS